MTPDNYETPLKCKIILNIFSDLIDTNFLNPKIFNCYNCESNEYYDGKEFEKICKVCKARISVTRNTMFHNVRFGIVKAFVIADEYHKSNYSLTSAYLSKKHSISQKTIINYLKKINKNQKYISEVFNTTNKALLHYEKLTR